MLAGSPTPPPTLPSFKICTHRSHPSCLLIIPPHSSFRSSPTITMLQFNFEKARRHRRPITLVSCKSSSSNNSNITDDDHHDYLEASLLVPETLLHYRMRKQISSSTTPSAMSYPSSSRRTLLSPFSRNNNIRGVQGKEASLSIGQGFLLRFQSPTIFLKISCHTEFFLLPIIVGEFAIERLIDSLRGDDSGDFPDQFQLIQNVVEKLQHKVKMVRITERVANTYFARLYFGKPGENEILNVDARPSDAINVATICKVPIYVSKQIVFTDAIRIGYGIGAMHDTKTTYDVSLDSAVDGPDSIAEELDLVRNLNLAIAEERYNDAAMWRDKLMEIRKSRHED